MKLREWWKLIDEHWDDILVLFGNVGIDLDSDLAIKQQIEEYKVGRNQQGMANWIFLIWDKAPDHPMIHKWPSWDLLCLLAAEKDDLDGA